MTSWQEAPGDTNERSDGVDWSRHNQQTDESQ